MAERKRASAREEEPKRRKRAAVSAARGGLLETRFAEPQSALDSFAKAEKCRMRETTGKGGRKGRGAAALAEVDKSLLSLL